MIKNLSILVSVIFITNSYAKLQQCEKVETSKGIRLICNNGVVYTSAPKSLSTKLQNESEMDQFTKTLNEEVILGERNSIEKICKVVYFDGDRQIFCDGLLYVSAHSEQQNINNLENNIVDNLRRAPKDRILPIQNYPSNDYNIGIQR